jgi:serine/threonine protein kinase
VRLRGGAPGLRERQPTYHHRPSLPPLPDPPTPGRLRDGIVNRAPLFPRDPWDALSPRARGLVASMLEKDPSRRISAAAAAAHPWFAEALRDAAPAAAGEAARVAC